MSYSEPIHQTIVLNEHDFGNAAEVLSIKGPAGYKGKLKQIGVAITEAVVGTDTAPDVQVGTAADNDAYAKLVIPNATADEAFYSDADDTDAILDADIPADTLVEINLGLSVGGTIAGKGHTLLRFEWYK